MNKERYNQVYSLLNKHLENDNIKRLIEYTFDPTSKETNGLSLSGLDKDSDTVEQLNNLGFKVIYPASLKEETVASMGTAEKYVYDSKMSQALVIDTKESHLSLDFANTIAKHYFSTGNSIIAGFDKKNNSITEYPHGNFAEGTNGEFQNLLNSLGFQTEMDEYGHVSVSSNIPYPAVQTSKFKQIFEKAKGKVQGAFAKLKSYINSKDQVKETDANERD